MKTNITTDGKTSVIVLVPENELEKHIILALNVYHAEARITKPNLPEGSIDQYINITIEHK